LQLHIHDIFHFKRSYCLKSLQTVSNDWLSSVQYNDVFHLI